MIRIYLKQNTPKEINSTDSFWYIAPYGNKYLIFYGSFIELRHDLDIINETLVNEIKNIVPPEYILFISTQKNFTFERRTPGIYKYKSATMTANRIKKGSVFERECTIVAPGIENLLDIKFLFDEFCAGRALPYLENNFDAEEQPRPIMTVFQAWLEFSRAFKRWYQQKLATL